MAAKGKKKGGGKGKGKKKGAKHLPAELPPSDPDEELVKKLTLAAGLTMEPPDPADAATGYEGEVSPLEEVPESEPYSTCKGAQVQTPLYKPMSTNSNIFVPTMPIKVDMSALRRAYNTLRMHYEPVFKVASTEGRAVQRLYVVYRFLCDRGETFEDGFPDGSKWQQLWHLVKMAYYTEGDGVDAVVYAKPRVCDDRSLETAFWTALEAGDIAAVADAVHQCPALVNMPHPEAAHFPLTLVAAKGGIHTLRFLLINSAMTNAPGPTGDMALHLACQRGRRDMVQLLLSYGAEAMARNVYGESPLHCACLHDDPEMTAALLQHSGSGSEAGSTYFGEVVPMHVAAARGHVDVIKKLIEYKADCVSRNRYGMTPLMMARNHPEAAAPLALADPLTAELLKEKKAKGRKGKKGKKEEGAN